MWSTISRSHIRRTRAPPSFRWRPKYRTGCSLCGKVQTTDALTKIIRILIVTENEKNGKMIFQHQWLQALPQQNGGNDNDNYDDDC